MSIHNNMSNSSSNSSLANFGSAPPQFSSANYTISNIVSGTLSTSTMNSSTYVPSYSSYGSTASLYISQNDDQIVLNVASAKEAIIRTKDGDINLSTLLTIVNQLKNILCVLDEQNIDDEKYPALKDAYDHFRTVEQLSKE